MAKGALAEMTDQEQLNEKLLKFAKFIETDKKRRWASGSDLKTVWRFPDDPVGLRDTIHPPNFPKSLDACFKWLVPKFLGYCIYKQGDNHVAMVIPLKSETGICTDGKTPALALCLAIEKLIDAEAK